MVVDPDESMLKLEMSLAKLDVYAPLPSDKETSAGDVKTRSDRKEEREMVSGSRHSIWHNN